VIENNLPAGALNVALGETSKIKPLESQQYQGAPDPHVWFNVKYFRVFAERTRDALIRADPAGTGTYRRAAAAYLKDLDALDRYARAQLGTIPKARRVLVTSHDAFQYLGKAYGIEVHAVIGISTEQEPRPQDVEALVKIVKERNVKAVFIETSVSPTLNALVRRVSERTGVRVGGELFSDSLGRADGPAGTYLGMVRHNVATITAALR
jgi:ABC-type Zn uptake system ZnuABC Zn-binding protein ZnuA